MRTLPFALTIFLSAFLLFQVQPLIGRYILPWFGGSAGVWSVTMLFFQALLLAGYAYAHLLNTRLKPVAQAVVHTVILGLCAVLLPIIPVDSLKPAPDAEPILGILLLLAATVGAPYFALATTGPLLQAWFSRAVPGKSPYPLYALSNVGSLLGLLTYPFLFERIWGRNEQAANWSWAFGLFALACVAVAWLASRGQQAKAAAVATDTPPSRRDLALWIGLPAVASALLLSVTNELCIDVASVPFLWVLPLSIYLLSFIVTFAGKKSPRRGTWYPLAGFATATTIAVMAYHNSLKLWAIVGAHAAALLVLCIVLHGETYRLRPGPSRLTKFYLCVSLGGVIGGLFVSVVAPLMFSMYLELHVALLAAALLLLVCLWGDPSSMMFAGRLRPVWGLLAALVVALGGALGWNVYSRVSERILVTRNFYGAYSVYETPRESEETWSRSLFSGTTLHGFQFIEPDHRRLRTSYYAPHSGVAIAVDSLADGPRRIGVVGLGAGGLAACGREDRGDMVKFYEINPRCPEIARDYFFYLKDSYAHVEVKLGDARLSLEQDLPQSFDLMAIDAFTSDSIPVHLLTVEAFELYLRHLKPQGLLCVHISNRHLDLAPVLRAAGVKLGLHMFMVVSADDNSFGAIAAKWVVMSRSPQALHAAGATLEAARRDFTPPGLKGDEYVHKLDVMKWREIPLWTDDYSNLFDVLN